MNARTTCFFACLALSSSFGCSAAHGVDETPPKMNPGGNGFGSGSDGGTGGDETGFDPGAPPVGDGSDCAEENKQIFVVTLENVLYRFDPTALKLFKIGSLACSGSSGTPFSMAVDRKGIAWVNFTDGSINLVNTKDAKCTASGYKVGQSGFMTFGMAFVAEMGKPESLFVSDYDQKGIGRIDTSSLTLSFVGSYGTKGPAELTGTGAARMFALFHDSNSVAELDRGSGSVLAQKAVPGLSVGIAFAFAHWGGDFWLFTSQLPGSTTITQFDFETGKSTVKGKAPLTIVGAGVSTCAPTARPK